MIQQQKKGSMFGTKMWFLEIMEMYKDPRNTDKHIKTKTKYMNKIKKQKNRKQFQSLKAPSKQMNWQNKRIKLKSH